MTKEELNEVLKLHKLWLDSEGEEGKRADLIGANLRFADLSGLNLRGACLVEVDLTGANLEGAILEGAKFKDVMLEDVNLTNTGVYFFKGPRHDGIYNSKDDKLYIGCQIHSLDYWLKNYVAIGKYYSYTDEQIEAYGNWIKSLKELKKCLD